MFVLKLLTSFIQWLGFYYCENDSENHQPIICCRLRADEMESFIKVIFCLWLVQSFETGRCLRK